MTLAVLPALEAVLTSNGIDYVVTVAGIGPILPNRAERQRLVAEAIEPSFATVAAWARGRLPF